MKQFILIVFLLCFGVEYNMAQTTGEGEKPTIPIEKLEWLKGYWLGDGFGGVSEEIWTHAADNTMMGMYRHIKDGKVTFYEFMHLTPEGMKLKHFNPDLTAWEDKEDFVIFPLLEVTEDKIIFKGMEIWKKSDNEMELSLKLNRNGKVETEVFHFKRSSL
ncbi:hypothetical protein JMN32_02075 [Fulvivirga sp. 29W222]|uniref:DUF6265 domain-containing protein n=1 Tax=Fulvivirga marina TaxID=2494733 RepID=A0A937FY54_9BACT|nr:DUF6265 family protein [Fulvivirga marina]MBL6445076.1 hypothetical protein [Fulvivirga marina]